MASPALWASENWRGDPRPLTAEDWSYERAAHLLERLGFGGTPREIEELANVTPRIAVDFLLNYHLLMNLISSIQAWNPSQEAVLKL